jgi:hypothetical protein
MEYHLAFVLLLLLGFVGLIGTLLPAFPGTGVIFAGALVYAALSGFTVLGCKHLAILFLLTLGGGIGQYLITGLGAKTMGASRFGIIGAFVGFVGGLLLIPIPGGALIGAFAGAFFAEVAFTLKDNRAGLKAGVGAVIGALASFLFEFLVGLAMVAYIFTVLWPHLHHRGGPVLEVQRQQTAPAVTGNITVCLSGLSADPLAIPRAGQGIDHLVGGGSESLRSAAEAHSGRSLPGRLPPNRKT